MINVSSDVELVQGLARQAAAGLEPVYVAYSAKLYTYALTMLRDPQAAQDVVHDALLVAAGSIGQLRDASKFRPWLYAITRNECLRTLRGRKRFSHSDEVVDVADTVDFEAGLRRTEAARLIGQAMAAMSPADRDIVSLALQHDLDAERIAKVTGTSPNTVHARLSRARSGLSEAVTALALYRSRRKCEGLRAIVTPDDQPLTPLLRKRIHRHVKSCDECQHRRNAALVAIGPAMAAPMFVQPPDSLRSRLMFSAHGGRIPELTSRAAPFQANGFPVPLDTESHSRWPLLAGTAAVALILIGLVALLIGSGEQPPVSAQTAPVTISSTPTPATTLGPTTVLPTATSPTAAPESGATDDLTTPAPVPPPVTIATAPPRTVSASPQPTASTPKPTKTSKPSKTPKPPASKKPPKSPSTTPTSDATPSQPVPPAAPVISSVELVNEDRAEDGSFTRCDAFTLRITAVVSGAVDSTVALITPSDTAADMSGDPPAIKVTLPPGEYSISVKATGPGGSTTYDAGKVLHICPG